MTTAPAWEDPRIASGMKQQLEMRREWLRAGRKSVGWKLAFGGPAAMRRLLTRLKTDDKVWLTDTEAILKAAGGV